LRENEMTLNIDEFNSEMATQKARSRKASESDASDWVILSSGDTQEFIGYETFEAEANLIRYRKVNSRGKNFYHLVFDKTPFYGESGGQVGDQGYIEKDGKKIEIIDTVKENNLSLHITKEIPESTEGLFRAVVNKEARQNTANNHSATHLLHHALREILGKHVEQKGSLVHPDYLRFDFSHYQKISDEQLLRIENRVNSMIRQNIPVEEFRDMPMDMARKIGAMALFGEKYGDHVRVIKFGDSVELCGGTHVKATGDIGICKIISEGSIAAGIRRIQAYTGRGAEDYINSLLGILKDVTAILDGPNDIKQTILSMSEQNAELRKKVEEYSRHEVKRIKNNLKDNVAEKDGINYIAAKISADSPALVKDVAFQMKNEIENLFLVLAAEIRGKAHLSVMISENLVKSTQLHAGKIIKELAKEIKGGGGGQPFFATAGGSDPSGIEDALKKSEEYIS
jgi:alanyl-tRNA synthetase